ncbi:hypothetical protein D1007_59280 [Hordeum vulgare]|nr:hypothetical protein D1007_59280 [Hordeum vulgare]
MKLLTAGLADIDYAVIEVDLYTHSLHGIDKCLDTIRVILEDTVHLPPFETVFSCLKLAEENLTQRVADESATILTVTRDVAPSRSFSGRGGSYGAPQGDRGDRPVDRINDRGGHGPPPSRGIGNHKKDGDHGRCRGHGRGRGRGDSGKRDNNHNSNAPPFNPHMGLFAPYGMALPSPRSRWIPPNSIGVLPPSPAAMLMRTRCSIPIPRASSAAAAIVGSPRHA